MAQNQMQGLFTGPGVNDVYARQRQERDQKVRQAMADSAGAGGNFYANLQAKANEQMSQAFQGGVRGLLQGTDLAPAEDPRLAAARKRETDKTEIMAMLSGYSEDDVITPDEMRTGYSELMRRGYPNEARQFLKDAQSEELLGVKKNTALAELQKAASGGVELKFEGPVMKAKDNTLWQAATTEGGKPVFMKLSGPEGAEYDPKGAVIVDTKGQTIIERVKEKKEIEANKTTQIGLRELYKNELAKGKDKAKAFLDRRTNELQSKLGISADMAKKRAGAELITEREYIKGGIAATEALPKAEELLAIVSSGDYTGGKATAAFKSFKRLFNIEGTDDAAFRTGTQMMLLKLLKPLMGAKATDQDLIELKDALANPMQSTEANKVILERFIKQIKKDKKAGKYFASDDKATLGGWFIKQDQFSLLGTVPTPQAQRRVGEMIRKDGEAYKWNGTTWDKQ